MKFILRTDTPEMRQERLKFLMEQGVPSDKAELVDQKRSDICDKMMRVLEEEVLRFDDEQKKANDQIGLSLLVTHGICMTMVNTFDECLNNIAQQAMLHMFAETGIAVVTLSEDGPGIGGLHDFLASILGEDGGTTH